MALFGGGDDGSGGGGIWQWVRLKLDKLTAQQVKAESQQVLSEATDPKASTRNLGLIGKAFDGVRIRAIALGTFLGGLFLHALDQAANAMRWVVRQSIEAQDAQAQLEARLRSTGGVAGRTAQQLNEQAAALQRITTFSDEAVTGVQTMLLQFTRVRGDVFDRATESALDLATALGMDAPSAAKTLGAALDNPIDGLRRLSQAGIIFTKGEKEVIEGLIRANRLADAQAKLLEKVEERMGGAARAARDTLGGALDGLKNAWGDAFEVSKSASAGIVGFINDLAEAVPAVRERLDKFFRFIQEAGINAAVNVERLRVAFRTMLRDRAVAGGASAETIELLNQKLEQAKIGLVRMEEAAVEMWADLYKPPDRENPLDVAAASAEGLLDETVDLKKIEDERFDALMEGHELAILKANEYLEILKLTQKAEQGLAGGGLSLEERIRQEQRRQAGSEALRSPGGRAALGAFPMSLGGGLNLRSPSLEQITTRTTKDIRLPTEGFAEFFIDNFDAVTNAAEVAAFGIQDAFENAFTALISEGEGMLGLFEELFKGIAAAGLDGIASLATAKVKENIAKALSAVGDAILGIDPKGFAAAAKYTASAAMWAAAGGLATSTANALTGGTDRPGADATGRAVDRIDQPRPLTIIKLDGFDPRNPAHVELLAAGQVESERQWGGQEPYVDPSGSREFVFGD